MIDAEPADTDADVSDGGDSYEADGDWPQLPQIELDVCLAPLAMNPGSPRPSDETQDR